MHLKPVNSDRQLPAHDEQQIEKLLNEAYKTAEFTAMGYSYPMNDNRLLLEYMINFFGNAEEIRFFRKAYKKNGQWRLSNDFKTVTCLNGVTVAVDIEDVVNRYMAE